MAAARHTGAKETCPRHAHAAQACFLCLVHDCYTVLLMWPPQVPTSLLLLTHSEPACFAHSSMAHLIPTAVLGVWARSKVKLQTGLE